MCVHALATALPVLRSPPEPVCWRAPRAPRSSPLLRGWGHLLMVTRLAWMAQRLQSSSRCTIKSSVASCSASSPSAVHRNGSGATLFVISRTCGGSSGACRRRKHTQLEHHPQARARVCPATASRLTSLEKGSLRMSSSVLRWNLRISRSATVPGLNL